MEIQNELISIIIPVYNSEKYLEAALESVKKQSYTEFEVLLIDDGSIDHSPQICDRYANEDDRFRVIHQENRGPSAARNRGIEEAKGEYITFFDNDDLLHQKFLEILHRLCIDYNCDIALTKSLSFLAEETIPIEAPREELVFMNHHQLSEQLLDMGWTGLAVTMAKLFRKTLFKNIRFHEDRIIADDDSSIYLLFWESKESVLFSTPLYFYRSKRQGSITHSNYQLSWMTGVDAFKERMDFYYLQGEKTLYAKAMRNYCRRMTENYIKIKENFPEKKEILKGLRHNTRKYVKKMFFLRGNSFKQKSSAIMFAYIPFLWNKIYERILG